MTAHTSLGVEDAKSQTLSERIAHSLRDAIIRGGLAPGQALRHEALSERLAVSYGPLREALRQLASEGFVQLVPFHGAVVASMDVQELHDYIDMAIALESMAVRTAAPLLSVAEIARARETLRRVEQEPDTGRWLDLNVSLRLGLYAPCGRARLLAEIKLIRMHSHRYAQVLYATPQGRGLALGTLGGLIDICAMGDGEGAAQHLAMSYTRGRDLIASQLQATESKFPRATAPPTVAEIVEMPARSSRLPGVRAAVATKSLRPPRSRRRPSGS